jgi:hypothetical protein
VIDRSLLWIVNDNILYKDAFFAVGVKGFLLGGVQTWIPAFGTVEKVLLMDV